jgi:hypothetical protein
MSKKNLLHVWKSYFSSQKNAKLLPKKQKTRKCSSKFSEGAQKGPKAFLSNFEK